MQSLIADTDAAAQVEAMISAALERAYTALDNAGLPDDAHASLVRLAVAATNRNA
jgi:hypothetical protein